MIELDAQTLHPGSEGVHVGHFETDVVDGGALRGFGRGASGGDHVDAAAGNEGRRHAAVFADVGTEHLHVSVTQCRLNKSRPSRACASWSDGLKSESPRKVRRCWRVALFHWRVD